MVKWNWSMLDLSSLDERVEVYCTFNTTNKLFPKSINLEKEHFTIWLIYSNRRYVEVGRADPEVDHSGRNYPALQMPPNKDYKSTLIIQLPNSEREIILSMQHVLYLAAKPAIVKAAILTPRLIPEWRRVKVPALAAIEL